MPKGAPRLRVSSQASLSRSAMLGRRTEGGDRGVAWLAVPMDARPLVMAANQHYWLLRRPGDKYLLERSRATIIANRQRRGPQHVRMAAFRCDQCPRPIARIGDRVCPMGCGGCT